MQLFVANLPFTVTEADLRSCFEQWGDLGGVRLMLDPVGNSRGFAFIDMLNDDDARRAIAELDGSDWAGRRIHVARARPARASALKQAQAG
ncbi:MAG TPA: RNA-binding protein [Bryobacteraceae bacterium]|nr:RNA-binding protein [Bryobacteraceae bacterium]